MKDEHETCRSPLPSAVNKREVRVIVYISDVEFRSEWEPYNPVNMANKVQAAVQQGHSFTVEVR